MVVRMDEIAPVLDLVLVDGSKPTPLIALKEIH
jgi:hypothetical protein